MRRCTLFVGIMAGLACAFPSRLLGEDISNISVNVIPFCGTDGFNIIGPMAVIVHVYNRSNGKISIIEDYADGKGINITIAGVEGEPIDKTIADRVEPHHLITINPNSEFNYRLYLSNMYRFSAPGVAQVSWDAKMHVIVNDSAESVTSSGNFTVRIRERNNEELGMELSRLLDFSINAPDPVTKSGMIEGICSIRDPAVLPFLQRLLNVQSGESRSLETLLRVWNADPNAEKIVDNYIKTTSDSANLRMIVGIYLEQRKLLTDSQLSHLLKSKDVAIRFCGILYIHGILDTLHLDSIPQFSRDPNGGIIAQCDEILKVFADILSKNESKSFKKQEAAKQSAGGF
jgi:hypothetical protein